jgi:YD repeat-containing protein
MTMLALAQEYINYGHGQPHKTAAEQSAVPKSGIKPGLVWLRLAVLLFTFWLLTGDLINLTLQSYLTNNLAAGSVTRLPLEITPAPVPLLDKTPPAGDWSLTAQDITFSTAHFTVGEPTTIRIVARNEGGQRTAAASLEVKDRPIVDNLVTPSRPSTQFFERVFSPTDGGRITDYEFSYTAREPAGLHLLCFKLTEGNAPTSGILVNTNFSDQNKQAQACRVVEVKAKNANPSAAFPNFPSPASIPFQATTMMNALTRQTTSQKTQSLAQPESTENSLRDFAAHNYLNLPLAFEPNQGQFDPAVQFIARGQNYTLYLTPDKAGLDLAFNDLSDPKNKTTESSRNALFLDIIGANPNSIPQADTRLGSVTNYFVGNNPANWRTDIPNYGRVKYEEVYPGIDLVYYGKQGQLEYDFVVKPGSDPNRISFKFTGATSQQIESDGSIILSIDQNDHDTKTKNVVRQHTPVIYQDVNGERRLIKGGYIRQADGSFRFNIAEPYDEKLPLVIDPVLSYATYFGNGSRANLNGVTVNAAGEVYITGVAFAPAATFPATPGAYQLTPSPTATTTAYVTKLSGDGSQLLYSTFLGGGSRNTGIEVAVNALGEIYIAGHTTSPDFPITPGAAQTLFKGGPTADAAFDAFVTRLNASGNALLYSTFLNSRGRDFVTGLKLDAAGNAYVTGSTYGDDFPVTAGAFQTTFNRPTTPENDYLVNGFVTKLSASGTSFIYSSYLSGSLDEFTEPFDIAVDNGGHAYVVGYTSQTDFPTTPGAFQSTKSFQFNGAFVTKFKPDGSGLVWSSFLAGEYENFGQAIAVDDEGHAYVTGWTSGSNFPTTPGAFQTTFQVGTDPEGFSFKSGFVTKVKPDGSGLVWSTYLGNTNYSEGRAIAIDNARNVIVSGRTTDNTFPVTPGAYRTSRQYDSATHLSKLKADGSQLLYGTFLASSNSSTARALAVDSTGNAYVGGNLSGASLDFSPTTGALQTSTTLTQTIAYLVKLDFSKLLFTTQPTGAQSGTPLTVQPVVHLVDNSGNLRTDFNGPVTVTIQPGTGTTGAVLQGQTTVTATGGVATFTDLRVDRAGNGYVLQATIGPSYTVGSAQSQSFVITSSTTPPLPQTLDLALAQEDLYLGRTVLNLGTPLTTGVTIRNIGLVTVTAGLINVTATLQTSSTPAATYSAALTRALIAGGVYSTGQFTLALPNAGNYSICASVQISATDPAGLTEGESAGAGATANNRACKEVIVLDPVVPRPQLSLRATSLETWPGARVTLLATVQNTGDTPLNLNDSSISGLQGATITRLTPFTATNPLAPGGTAQLGFEVVVDKPFDLPGAGAGAGVTSFPYEQLVALTVGTAEGVSASTELTVRTLAEAPTRVTVTIVNDANSQPIPGVLLMVENSEQIYETNAAGQVVIETTPGARTFYTYHPDYLAQADEATLEQRPDNTFTIKLKRGQTFEVSDVVATPLTPAQAAARGVVLTDPDNQIVYDFVIYLKIGEPIIIYNIVEPRDPAPGSQFSWSGGGGGGCTGCGGGGAFVFGTTKIFGAGQRVDTWIIIPGRFRILKQFWDAKIYIKNNSQAVNPNSIVITNLQATLDLPAGLGLPNLNGIPQQRTKNLDPLPAGQGRQIDWVVRGDAPGSYLLPATVKGELKFAGITTTTPLEINAFPAQLTVYAPTLDVTFRVPSEVVAGREFSMQVIFINTTPIDLYEVSVEILADKVVNATLTSPALVKVGTMRPAEAKEVEFRFVPDLTGCVIIPESFVIGDPNIRPRLNFTPSRCGGLLTTTNCWTTCLPLGGQVAMNSIDIGSSGSASSQQMGLGLVRYYNSQLKEQGSFGVGAYSNYEVRAVVTATNGTITLKHPDGRQDLFVPSGAGGYSGVGSSFANLTRAGDRFIYTLPNSLSYAFRVSDGKLIQMRDGSSSVTDFDYNGQGLLVRARDNANHTLTITYTTNNRISEASDGYRKVSYGYDSGYNRVTSVTDPRGFTVRYEYNTVGLLSEQRDQFNNVVMRNTYDGNLRLISQTLYAGPNPNQAYTTRWDYISRPGKVLHLDARGHTTTFTLDSASGQPVQIVNAKGYTHTTQLDSNYRPVVVTDVNGTVVRSEYNYLGLPTVVTSTVTVEGVVQTLSSSASYNGTGDPLVTTDVRGNQTFFQYAYPGKPSVITQPLDLVTRYSYDGQARLESIRSPNGLVTRYAYDIHNQVSSITKEYPTLVPGPAPESAPTLAPKSYRTDYQYSPQGWLLYQSDPYEVASGPHPWGGMRFDYDAGGFVLTSTNQLGQKAFNRYDNAGNLVEKTNIGGQKTIYTYDWLKRLTSITEAGEGQNLTTRYQYDANGNLERRTDPRDVTTSHWYDELNRLTRTEVPLLAGGVDRVDNQYDRAGNQIAQIRYNPKGSGDQITRFEYDELNRLVKTIHGWGVFNYEKRFVYDKADNLIFTRASLGDGGSVTDWNSPTQVVTTSATFDPLNRVLTERVNAYNPLTGQSQGYTNGYGYDDKNRRVSTTNPYGTVSIQETDAVGRVISTTMLPASASGSGSGSGSGNAADSIEPGAQAQTSYLFYDARDFAVRTLDPARQQVDMGYDPLGRPISSTVYTEPNGRGTPLTGRTYYGDGNRPRMISIGPAPHFVRQDSQIDELGRLESTTVYTGAPAVYPTVPGGALTIGYRYDKQGNQTAVVDPKGHVTNFEYENTGWLLRSFEEVTLAGAGKRNRAVSYRHDNIGNLLEVTDPNTNTVKFGYDVLNRTTRVQNALGETHISKYDGLGRLTESRDAKGQVSSYRYDNNARLLQIATAGKITTTYTYNAGHLVTSRFDQNAAPAAGAPISTTVSYRYDGMGRLASFNSPQGVTRYVYDIVGRRTQLNFGPSAGQLKQVSYRYDALSRLTRLTNWLDQTLVYNYLGERLERLDYPNATVTNFNYDGTSALTGIAHTQGTPLIPGNNLYRASYALDALGNRTTVDERVLSTTRQIGFGYDELSRVLTETTSTNGGRRTVNSYGYDLVGNRLRKTLSYDGNPFAAITNYSYDRANRMLSSEYRYDISNLYTFTNRIDYAYDPNGNLTREVNRQTFGWGRGVTAPTTGQPPSPVPSDKPEPEPENGTPQRPPGSGSGSGEETSDEEVPTDAGTEAATADPAQSLAAAEAEFALLSEQVANGKLGTNADPTPQPAPAPNAVFSFTSLYTTTYNYDARDRLQIWQRQYATNGTVRSTANASFGYDGNNRRLNRTFGSTTTTFFEDPTDGATLEERVNGRQRYTFLSTPGTRLPLFRADVDANNPGGAGARNIWFHHDADGSVRATSNAGGQWRNVYSFDAFGVTVQQQGAGGGGVTNDRQFEGEQLDPTGLYFDGCSYYQASTAMVIGGDNCSMVPAASGWGGGGSPQGSGSAVSAPQATRLADALRQGPPSAMPCECVVQCDLQIDLVRAPDPPKVIVNHSGGNPIADFFEGIGNAGERLAHDLVNFFRSGAEFVLGVGGAVFEEVTGLKIPGSWELMRQGWQGMKESAANIRSNPLTPLLSAAISFIPIIGDIKDVLEAGLGYDLLTGQKLETWERVLNILPLGLEVASELFAGVAKGVGRADELLDAGSDGRRVANSAASDVDNISDVAKRGDNIAANAPALDRSQQVVRNSDIGADVSRGDNAVNAGDVCSIARKNSFTGETPVLSEDGLKPIEQLVVGDKVWAEDPLTGESGWRSITWTTNHQAAGDLVQITVVPTAEGASEATQVNDNAAHALNYEYDYGYDFLAQPAGIAGAQHLGSRSGSSSGPSPAQLQRIQTETVEATPQHPIWVVGKGWTDASELQTGDRLLAKDGDQLSVTRLHLVSRTAQVYNFEVAGLHTYFVGEREQWLVHNCGDADADPFEDLAQKRQELGLPAAGDATDDATLARLDIDGETIYGKNAPGAKHPLLPGVMAPSLVHGEGDALSQAIAKRIKGGEATLYVDRVPCPYCKSSFGGFAKALDLDELTVVGPDNYLGKYTKVSGKYRTVRKPKKA